MSKKTTLKWRLSKLPTAEELLQLVEAKIITNDEAKDVLFSTETQEDVDAKALKDEIKFLRSLVSSLSNNSRTTIIETIREVEKPWRKYNWFDPYITWTTSGTGSTGTMYLSGSDVTLTNSSSGVTSANYLSENTSFEDIQTFN